MFFARRLVRFFQLSFQTLWFSSLRGLRRRTRTDAVERRRDGDELRIPKSQQITPPHRFGSILVQPKASPTSVASRTLRAEAMGVSQRVLNRVEHFQRLLYPCNVVWALRQPGHVITERSKRGSVIRQLFEPRSVRLLSATVCKSRSPSCVLNSPDGTTGLTGNFFFGLPPSSLSLLRLKVSNFPFAFVAVFQEDPFEGVHSVQRSSKALPRRPSKGTPPMSTWRPIRLLLRSRFN